MYQSNLWWIRLTVCFSQAGKELERVYEVVNSLQKQILTQGHEGNWSVVILPFIDGKVNRKRSVTRSHSSFFMIQSFVTTKPSVQFLWLRKIPKFCDYKPIQKFCRCKAIEIFFDYEPYQNLNLNIWFRLSHSSIYTRLNFPFPYYFYL